MNPLKKPYGRCCSRSSLTCTRRAPLTIENRNLVNRSAITQKPCNVFSRKGFRITLRIINKLRDRLLLGQFQQGLLLKWKNHFLKLPLDSFLDAVHQARIAEAVKAQLLESREDKSKGKHGRPQSSSQLQVETPRQPATEVSRATRSSEIEDNTQAKGKKSKPWIKWYRCWGRVITYQTVPQQRSSWPLPKPGTRVGTKDKRMPCLSRNGICECLRRLTVVVL